ncbi:DUF4371 domain-containing protein [Cephalotus follicularis]|uniref:DUF4371 domain-containing protein n=1 Tax=Cephalotus follicularis TaxID=3775 RepID=A0A1Q3DIH3_CEPFO|nr:DUF4371 domain-containing protein [Cephalotus follicularis]
MGDQIGGDSFVSEGLSNWKKPERFQYHVGWAVWNEFRTHLTASIDCIRFLLRQGLTFHGHDESQHNFMHLIFSMFQIEVLDSQLDTYIIDMHFCDECSELIGIGDLAKRLVGLKKDILYLLVFKLVKFALILSVATTTVEKVSSAMNIVKNRLHNGMGDEWMNDCLVIYIENDIFNTINNKKII